MSDLDTKEFSEVVGKTIITANLIDNEELHLEFSDGSSSVVKVGLDKNFEPYLYLD